MRDQRYGKRWDKPERGEQNQMIFGIRSVMEAVESGKEIESLFVQRGLSGGLMLELKQMLKSHAIPFQSVPVEKLNRLTRKNHQGVIGVISPITYQQLEQLVPMVYEKGEVPLFLILDGITDVRNLGAIARSAACAGVHGLVVPQKGSAEINPDAIKTSAGALFSIPVCREESLSKAVKFMQESGIQVIACTEKTKDPIYGLDLKAPTALVVGSEEQGVSQEILRIADGLARIPMTGEISSLNVSVAAGIVLFEGVRQRLVESSDL